MTIDEWRISMRYGQTVLGMALMVIGSWCSDPAFCADAGTRCRVSEATYQGYASLVLENDYVMASFIPAFGGRLAEYTIKPAEANQLFPFLGEKKETMPGVVKTTTNNGGLEDRFWRFALPNTISPYQVKILDNGPAQAAVLLSWENAVMKIEKTVALAETGVELKIEIKVTNKSAQPATWQYWPAAMVQAGGDFTPRGSDWMYEAVRVKGGSDTLRKEQIIPGHLFPWETPLQGWIAVLDREKKNGLGFNVPVDELLPDGFHYVWCGEKFADPGLAWPPNEESRSKMVLLQEIYGTRNLPPGATQVYHLSVIGFSGLADLDYLSSHLALALDSPEHNLVPENGKISIAGTVVLLAVLPGSHLRLLLVDQEGKEGGSITVPFAGPAAGALLNPYRFQGSFSTAELTPGSYSLKAVLDDSNGQAIEAFDVLVPIIKIK